jgi:hypothetical protein
MRPITRVILHCSATQDYPPDNAAFDLIGAADIREWHMKDRSWSDIGYHLVVRRTGEVEKGRNVKDPGAHARGNNYDSIGICYIGTKSPTPEQIAAFGDIFLTIREKYGVEAKDWWGHYEFTNKKTCPGIPMGLVRAYLDVVGQLYE